mmetsp:Transcript_38103/g.55961  ORF Transcript_38103/g.55961 Transcript_38103/m.55961 type:complete len:98 (-) Transcript_38103:928-1221(-)
MLSSQSTTITVNLLLLLFLCIQTYIASGQQHHPRQLRKRQKDDGKRKFHLQQNGLIKDAMNDLHLNAKKNPITIVISKGYSTAGRYIRICHLINDCV